jgi:hypothetical protein
MKSQLKAVLDLHERLYHGLKEQPNDRQTDEQLAGENLFAFSTFRLPAASDLRPLIGFSVMKSAITRCLKSSVNPSLDEYSVGIIVSSSSCDHVNAQHYIRSMSGKKNLTYIIKDRISFRGEFSWTEWITWFFFALKQSLRTLGSKQKSNMALTIIEVLEISVLLKWLERYNLKSIYDFVPFEVDSNFMYLCTRELGAHTTKIPSPGPLSTHNKIMLCDSLVLSGGYHFEEVARLKARYHVGSYISWPPERAHTYYDLYSKSAVKTNPMTLGFYSHGEWIRKKNGLVKDTSSLLQAEEESLRFLGRFLSEHPDFSLTIYPHPKERKSCSADELQSYYCAMTGSSRIEIASADKGTTLRFQEVDMAITCYSTIIFERLYCGFKTLIKRIDEHDFPKAGSPLNTVCFENYEQLSALIMNASSVDKTHFFEQHGLNDYLHHHFPTPISNHG